MSIEMTPEQVEAYQAQAINDIICALMPENAEFNGEMVSLIPVEAALDAASAAIAWLIASTGHFATPRDRRLLIEDFAKRTVKLANQFADNPEVSGVNLLNILDKNVQDVGGTKS